MTDRIENNIIRRVRSGETNAFEFLVKRYEKQLFIMIGNMVRDRSKVEDIVQEVFLSAYQNLTAFKPERGRFSTWIFRIARNKCLNDIKRKKELLVDTLPDQHAPETPDSLLLRKEMFCLLDGALQQLAFQDRIVFVLAEFNDLSLADIAEIENIPVGTVKSRLSRTRKKLRKKLNSRRG